MLILCIQLNVKDVKHDTKQTSGPAPSKRRGFWGRIAIALLFVVIGFAATLEVMLHRAEPILRGRIVETLATRFDSRVEMDKLHVSVLSGLEVAGDGLRIFPPDGVVDAGAKAPLISLERFAFHVNVMGLFQKPMHVGTVKVSGMTISIPPREMRQQGPKRDRRAGKIKIVVDQIDFDDSKLIIGTMKPDKDPKKFALKHIVMHNVGPNDPWRYDATLVNAVPTGNIHAVGTFGPWVNESPGDSAVTGKYTFDRADLNTIKGIAGILSSVGEFNGQLNRIVVDGTTETPDFSLDTAHHPMPLHTKFHAIVDGTSGDTYLQPVEAKLGDSEFTCRGEVINIKGKGHQINLDVDVPNGRIQDFLELAVKAQPAIMTGRLNMKTKLTIHPGKESVTQKIGLNGHFTLRSIHFVNPEWQDKVDMMSLRAQGEAKQAKPGAEDVSSLMTGQFGMGRGKLHFNRLAYALPGADINLAGVYSLDGNELDFDGKVRTKAALSNMVATWWKSWLLKPVDPFFRKNGAGAEIPVKISGSRGAPKFGLALKHKDKDKEGN
ncbi:AsmA-like C-terminal region-containing protein [Edaphobacter modestus]|uniref:AsmA-like protein n=1 Tax=Edaphobacter modestus TaxID=388466 RepID=A0A4Q7YYW0_9BACT|nr:AsmA-like C-terminal region-containing protein [Edaphobacter modestus]RZU42958.1 AsmA-like protein [Edaphobacter modestus]